MIHTKQIVHHPRLGRGYLIRTYRNGKDWEVQFDSGNRFRLPQDQFGPEVELGDAVSSYELAFKRRHALEALRTGIVPMPNVEDLTIGLKDEQAKLQNTIKRAMVESGDAFGVIADYGCGKSHFIELGAKFALRQKYIVATASLDMREAPPNKAREIYKALCASMRYLETDERGLWPLIRRALENREVIEQFTAQRPREDCPVASALHAMSISGSPEVHADITAWLSAQKSPSTLMRKWMPRPPRLYATGDVARQYAYLLTAISKLANMLGYAGLAVLIDESEHYAFLKPDKRERADSFFKSLILASVGENGQIDPQTIPNHKSVDYPITFGGDPHLFFMFASTDFDGRMPVESWLPKTHILRLSRRFGTDDIQKWLEDVLNYHGEAFQYPIAGFRYDMVFPSLADQLSRGLEQFQITIRDAIRLSVFVMDLIYTHKDLTPAELKEDIKKNLTRQ